MRLRGPNNPSAPSFPCSSVGMHPRPLRRPGTRDARASRAGLPRWSVGASSNGGSGAGWADAGGPTIRRPDDPPRWGSFLSPTYPGFLRRLRKGGAIGGLLAGLLLLVCAQAAFAETVHWIAPGDGDWGEPANWSSGALPGADDDVVVAADVTVTHASGDSRIRGLSLIGSLRLTGGTLTLTRASIIDGNLLLAPGAGLVAEGPDASLDVAGDAALEGGDLLALDGARISLPGATRRGGDGGLISARGASSRIELVNLGAVGIAPTSDPELTEGISRVVAVYQGPADSPEALDDLGDGISRVVAVYQGPADAPNPLTDIRDGISRAVAVYQGPADAPDPLTDIREGISRAVAVYQGPADSPEPLADLREGISRAVSAYQGPSDSEDPLDDLREGISRAVGVRQE